MATWLPAFLENDSVPFPLRSYNSVSFVCHAHCSFPGNALLSLVYMGLLIRLMFSSPQNTDTLNLVQIETLNSVISVSLYIHNIL